MEKSDLTRWEFSKSKSKYHFDHFRNEDVAPPFKILGHVPGPLIAEFNRLIEIQPLEVSTFATRLQLFMQHKITPYTLEYDMNELKSLGLPEDCSFFHVLKINQSELFQKIVASFGMTNVFAKIHVQKPGQFFPYHIDELPALKKNEADHWLDDKPESAARFEIQLLDWVPGHVWTYGNTYWKQWKSGEIAYHEWRDIPHGTANISHSWRASLQVSGFVTDKTTEIIKNGYFYDS